MTPVLKLCSMIVMQSHFLVNAVRVAKHLLQLDCWALGVAFVAEKGEALPEVLFKQGPSRKQRLNATRSTSAESNINHHDRIDVREY